MLILELLKLCIIMILLRLMEQIQPWRNGVLGMELSWRLIFSNLSLINLGILNNK